MRQSRIDTEAKLLDAVGQLIAANGLSQVGINRVASQSGINKMLIYRYFGGLDGLLKTYYERNPPVVSIPPIDVVALKDASLDKVFDACYQYVIDEFRQLRKNPEALEFLKAGLMSNGDSANGFADEKEAHLHGMVDELARLIGTDKGRPFSAIMLSAMTLLALMSQQKKLVMGIDLSSDEGWAEIEASLKNIYRGGYLYTRERLANEQQTSSDSAEEVE